jgi:lysophospholipase L1-like esterase
VKATDVIIEKIREKLPKTQILLVGQLPRGNKAEDNRAINIDNLLKKDYAVEKEWIHYLDISEKFRDTTTKLENKSLYVADGVHLNKEGYKLWAESMEPLFKKLLES